MVASSNSAGRDPYMSSPKMLQFHTEPKYPPKNLLQRNVKIKDWGGYRISEIREGGVRGLCNCLVLFTRMGVPKERSGGPDSQEQPPPPPGSVPEMCPIAGLTRPWPRCCTRTSTFSCQRSSRPGSCTGWVNTAAPSTIIPPSGSEWHCGPGTILQR